jgi:hypothetical protein
MVPISSPDNMLNAQRSGTVSAASATKVGAFLTGSFGAVTGRAASGLVNAIMVIQHG